MSKSKLRVTITAKHVSILEAITNGATTNKEIAREVEEAESNTLGLLGKMKTMGMIEDTHRETTERRGLRVGEGRRHWSVTDVGESAWAFYLAVEENVKAAEQDGRS